MLNNGIQTGRFALVVVSVCLLACSQSESNGRDAGTTPITAGNGGTAGAGTSGRGGGGGTVGSAGTTGAAGATAVAGTTGAAGTAGAGGSAAATTPPDLGKACNAATDCTGGLMCMRATDNILDGTSGPAHGYCTRSCGTDTDCGSGGACLDTAAAGATTPVGYCFKRCTFGGPGGSSKCHGRLDVACATLDATTSPPLDVCYPICSQDSDCPTGRKCDLSTSQCTDTPRAGDPLGSHCTRSPDGGASNCAGGCLPIGGAGGGTTVVASFCSMLCVVGNLMACNWVGAGMSLASGTGVHGVCALASANAMAGDIGYCTQECDTAADCRNQTDPGVMCDVSAMSAIGHGFCSW
jgi:hypothetical protein